MRVLITSNGDHDPKGHHLVVVDDRLILLDLSGIQGSLHDAGIQRAEWGMVQDGNDVRPGGTITTTDGTKRTFFDPAAISPYIQAFEAEWENRRRAAAPE